MKITTRTLLVGMALLAPIAAPAAQQSAVITAIITGGTTRTWVLTNVQTFMGNTGRCLRGETYQFDRRHVIITRCVNQRFVTSRFDWRVLPDQNGENVVEIGKTQYYVRFRSDAHLWYMRLRTVTKAADQNVVDEDLRFAKPGDGGQ